MRLNYEPHPVTSVGELRRGVKRAGERRVTHSRAPVNQEGVAQLIDPRWIRNGEVWRQRDLPQYVYWPTYTHIHTDGREIGHATCRHRITVDRRPALRCDGTIGNWWARGRGRRDISRQLSYHKTNKQSKKNIQIYMDTDFQEVNRSVQSAFPRESGGELQRASKHTRDGLR